jgi:hypothetical protein
MFPCSRDLPHLERIPVKQRARLTESIIPAVQRLRRLQALDGAIERDSHSASTLIAELEDGLAALDGGPLPRPAIRAAIADLRRWRAEGIDEPPDFSLSRDQLEPPQEGEFFFFLGPARAQNGPSGVEATQFECLLALRDEGSEISGMRQRFPHRRDGCQSTRLLCGSESFARGNCIVFFPEYILARTEVHEQRFAVFFFNKFRRIYLGRTMPTLRRVFGEQDQLCGAKTWRSARLSHERCYDLRCVWGYLHDYFHHRGPRPLDQSLQLKQDWFASLLEELKADCQVVLTCAQERFPGWLELVEFVLFDRMLRYPLQTGAEDNFDSGTGAYLFEILLHGGAITRGESSLGFDLDRSLASMREFVAEVEAIEVLEDRAYLTRCREMVLSVLPASSDGHYFAMPQNYRELVGERQ